MRILASSAPTMPLTVETCFHICLRTKVSGTCRVFTHRTYLRNFPERTERETAPKGGRSGRAPGFYARATNSSGSRIRARNAHPEVPGFVHQVAVLRGERFEPHDHRRALCA